MPSTAMPINPQPNASRTGLDDWPLRTSATPDAMSTTGTMKRPNPKNHPMKVSTPSPMIPANPK